MTDAVLVILRIPESHDDGVTLTRVNGRLDVRPELRVPQREERVLEKAFLCAKEHSLSLVALLILSSDLFHWGFNDIILSGPAKSRFIGHVRQEIMARSAKTLTLLEEKARLHGVPLEVQKRETPDVASAVLEEVQKGYEKIFMVKEKSRFFPIFKKTLEQELRKGTSTPIVTYP